jgi:hypothetical protein
LEPAAASLRLCFHNNSPWLISCWMVSLRSLTK